MSTSPDTSSSGTLPVDGARNAKPDEDQDGRPQDIPSNVTGSITTVDADAEGKPDEHEDEDGKTDEESESEEGSSGSGEEEEEEEDDDDDEEPALKYERITGEIPDLFKKDSASALTVSNKLMALGTHAGIIHILDLTGKRIKSYKPHLASVVDISLDATADFVATASIDGQVVVHSLSTPENYSFDMKRPMRTVAMEPNFAKKSSRAFVCGGLSGALVMREKGWLGHKETTIHSGEGPIWQVRWRGQLIAWANDTGVKIYDTASQMQPAPDLFKCTLHWQDDSTLLVAWANFIKVARIRSRPRTTDPAAAKAPPLLVEITAVFQLDCIVAGVVPHPTPPPPALFEARNSEAARPQTLTAFLVVAYTPPETFDDTDEMTDDRRRQARKLAERPEMRIISRAGEELAADALTITDYQRWGCNDYTVAEVSYIVMSPRDLVRVLPRDKRDHVAWLVERRRYEEALAAVEKIEAEEAVTGLKGTHLSAQEIGQMFIEHLVQEGDFTRAAQLCPNVCAHDSKRWENWIFAFAQKRQLQCIIPYVPTDKPRLDHVVYEMVLAHFLTHDRDALLHTIKEWPREIYDIAAVIVAVRAELDTVASTSSTISSSSGSSNPSVILMECLAELYTANRQPGKALPYYLRLRRANVFDLIRENNLFTDVQDQVLLLVEFDHELMEKRKASKKTGDEVESEAIKLLVDNIHSIPLVTEFADIQVKMYAEFATSRLIDFLRASSSYNLEIAYKECQDRDLVPEMKALTLIIERLGDVHRAIDFAKEQSDDDLWEDSFIRGLLENVGVEISPIRLIRRIKNGLEIPGLKEALIKILQDFHLQISLLEGCQTILNGDSSDLSRKLDRNQSSGFFLSLGSRCKMCRLPLHDSPHALTFLFLCRHVVHAACVSGAESLALLTPHRLGRIYGQSAVNNGCPVCHKNGEAV
ncbi:vacuolar assembling protein VPS41 [Pholiota molesta]|nr:vacuolar assembling protein VPS41 [Pholiota molesta]